MSINRKRGQKNAASPKNPISNTQPTSSSTVVVPSFYQNDYTYNKISFLPNTSTSQYQANGFTGYTCFWVTNDGKQILNSGRSAKLSGRFAQDALDWAPIPCKLKPTLDRDDYIIDYAMGSRCTVFCTAKGYVYTGGNNEQGQLGHNDVTIRPHFERVATYNNIGFGPGLEKAIRVYTNSGPAETANRRTLVLTASGKLFGSGHNGNYEMGVSGNAAQQNTFIRCAPTLSNIVEVYPGSYTTGVITEARTLYTFGVNTNGEMGLGNTTSPQQSPVLSSTNVALVRHNWNYYGYRSSFILKTDGPVWFTGSHDAAGGGDMAGLGDNTQRTSWTQVTTNLSGRNIVDIATGGWTESATMYGITWFLTDDGKVFATGYNAQGAIGDGTTTGRMTPTQLIIPAGFPKTDALCRFGNYSVDGITGINKETGRMWSVGTWMYGATGYGFGDFSSTWTERTATSHRAMYPAREVDPPPPIQDGYAKFHSMMSVPTEPNTQQAMVVVLCTDGTAWVRGRDYYGTGGTRHTQRDQGTVAHYSANEYNYVWKQVRL